MRDSSQNTKAKNTKAKNAEKSRAEKPQTYRQKVAGKEANILRAAQAVFKTVGYQGLRMSDVAKKAGVAEGTVYSYYTSKDDLIRALLGAYWAELTKGARAAVADEAETYSRLKALAQFHIDRLIARYDYAELTITLGRQLGSTVSLTDSVRTYVRVFDEIFTAGQDRGDIAGGSEVWIARDMFYGALEYSARTLLMRAKAARKTPPVVENLMACFNARYAAQAQAGQVSVVERLERVAEKLEARL